MKNLTLVDCNIQGLSKLLDVVGRQNLEQLIIIYNDDIDEEHQGDNPDEAPIYSELMDADLPSFKNLRYFEYSLYNETEFPSFN